MQDVSPPSQLLTVDLLRSVIGGLEVGTVYPRDAPPEYVVVQRVGGVLQNAITDAATFSVQCYAPDQLAAEMLAGRVWHALYRQEWAGIRISGHMLRAWQSAGAPQMLVDPERPHLVRFQFAGQLLVSTLRRAQH
ncbi:hypothetical protein [Corynebacterium lactis]|uniref:Uncharacterized protein n=1 Tax=Corynebacterium lactis RW2-5 TaxID=1408189 RepID=A0A0K2H4B0_9CORY|nr:hypothetical protein [Corynebacterium lactis]ALA68551.1 hypothetical protein CLAC_07305 [Corynebacterium lactis RW2-5]